MKDQNLKDPTKPSGPVQVRNLTIQIDRDLCIGAATCVAIAPKAFSLDQEAKAIIIDTAEGESDEILIDAARGCPTTAITILDANGNKLFPK